MLQLQADDSGLITWLQKGATSKPPAPDEPLMKRLCLETGNVHQQVKELIMLLVIYLSKNTLFLVEK